MTTEKQNIIFQIIGAIDKLVREEERRLMVPDEIQKVFGSLHFTETNRARFQKVYRNWRSLFPRRLLFDLRHPPTTANDLIQKLERELSNEAERWKLT